MSVLSSAMAMNTVTGTSTGSCSVVCTLMYSQTKVRMYAPTDDQSKLKLVKIIASSATKLIMMSGHMYTLQTYNDWWQWRSKQQMQC